jgi:hypothetical protein
LEEASVDRIAKDISSFVFRMLIARDAGARKAAGLSAPGVPSAGGAREGGR